MDDKDEKGEREGKAAPAPNPRDFTANVSPDSLTVNTAARVEPSLASAAGGSRWQFERLGYFCVDSEDSTPAALVFNRTVTLRDTWKKIQKQQQEK